MTAVQPRADAGYGDQPRFLDGLEDRRLPYVVGVPSIARFRIADEVERYPGDEPPPPYRGIGRPRKAKGLEARFILGGLERDSWCVVAWRKGTRGVLRKLCTRIRVYRVGYRCTHVESGGWLIGERPVDGNQGEAKYYFAWGMDQMPLEDIVELAHSRWIIERFYQDAKGEAGARCGSECGVDTSRSECLATGFDSSSPTDGVLIGSGPARIGAGAGLRA